MVVVACAAMAGITCYGFHASAPSLRNERKAPRASQLHQLREVRPCRVQQRQGSGSLHVVVRNVRSAGKGWALLSERLDGGDQEQFSEVRLSAFRAAFEICDVGPAYRISYQRYSCMYILLVVYRQQYEVAPNSCLVLVHAVSSIFSPSPLCSVMYQHDTMVRRTGWQPAASDSVKPWVLIRTYE